MLFWIAFGATLITQVNAAEAYDEASHLLNGYTIVMEAPTGELQEVVGPFEFFEVKS